MSSIPASAQEVLHQQRDIFLTVAQWGEAQAEDVEAVEQVQAEPSGCHFRLQVAVGRGDDPQVHLAPLQRPYGAEFALLQQAQQLDLHIQRQVADFVEKRRAVVGQFHQPAFVLHGAAERALHVPEELALHQRAHQRAAIDRHELAARVGIVNRPRHHFFPCAALA